MIFGVGFEQPTVRIELTDSVGPRRLETQTQAAIIRDYLAAWKTLSAALQQNRADLLDAAFVGIAKEKLTETVQAQRHLGIRTVYQDRSHDLKLLFYSPEGLSVQLSDTVEYDVRVMDHDKLQGTRRVQARYLAVLTPSEVQWKVRIFQAAPSN
jgi:hypothetical protein